MSDNKPSASKSNQPRTTPSITNIKPSKVPAKVASKVMSAVDLQATKAAIMTPLQKLTGQEEEYDPHKHRNVPNPTSYSETMTHMLKACFGVGMLAMPQAISRLGLIFGFLGTCFLGFFATYCLQILVLAMYQVCKKHKVGYLPYPKIMFLALREGPPILRWTATPFAIIVDALLIFWQIGVCAVFLVFVSENLKEVIRYCSGNEMPLRILICCLYPPLIILCLTKNLKLMAPLSTFSNCCNFFGIALVFFYLIVDDIEIDDDKFKLKSFMDIPAFIGTVLFAIEAVGVILALEYNMENPKEFTGWFGLLSIGTMFIIAMYTALGIFGYIKYGMEAKASITLNLPQTDKKAQVAKAAFAASICTSFPLQNYVAWQIIWGYIEKKFTNKKFAADMALRVALATLPFVMAVAAPALGPIIGLLGSLCLTTAAILFPALLDIVVYYPNRYGFCAYKLFTDILIIIFGGFCCFSGCYVSLQEMIVELS